MSLAKITQISGTAVSVPGDDIDTDRIIPARFMKCVTFDGLGDYFFYDVRKHEDGSEKSHPLNETRFAGASILLTGNNFGCGSSREHAPQALYRAGFRAVIAEGFAEIFFGNSTQLGIPCVSASHDDLQKIMALVEADPSVEITIDVANTAIKVGEASFPCTMRESAREVLVDGRWDPIADLLANAPKVEKVAARLAYFNV